MSNFAQDEAGDVAISASVAATNARRLGHSLTEEIKILILHGTLHLAGHDHETDNGEMANRERRLRKSLGLPDGLIERAAALPTTRAPRRKASEPTSRRAAAKPGKT